VLREESVLRESGYLEQVRAACRSASDREILFDRLAGGGWSEDRREKLRVLQRLELETLTLLATSANRNEWGSDRSAQLRSRARALAGMRWIDAIESLAREIPRCVDRVELLERSSPVDAAARMARVTAHHVALQMFLQLELRGRARVSIHPALALIPPDLPLAAAAG